MMMAGNPGHVNTVASKKPYLGTNQSWEKQLLKNVSQKTPGNKESGIPGLTPEPEQEKNDHCQ